MISKDKGEIILYVGAAGGSLTLFGIKSSDGQWKFYTELNEIMVYEHLPKEDRAGLIPLSRSPYIHSIEEALNSLEPFEWFKLYPMEVHPEFLEIILAEVQRLGGPSQVKRWTERINRIARPI